MTCRFTVTLTILLTWTWQAAAQPAGLPVEPPPPADATQQTSAAFAIRVGDEVAVLAHEVDPEKDWKEDPDAYYGKITDT